VAGAVPPAGLPTTPPAGCCELYTGGGLAGFDSGMNFTAKQQNDLLLLFVSFHN